MKRLVGLDMNGWRDLAWRSWVLEDGDILASEEGRPVQGGYGAVAIRPTAAPARGRRRNPWIGGPQALLAPHGQGEGFGPVGQAPRRLLRDEGLADALDSRDTLAASVGALAAGGDFGVLAIPDDATCGEARRELLLSALREVGLARRMLVWRPVLASLARAGLVAADRTLLVVSQVAGGLAVQRLVIRRDDDLEVPERKAEGRLIPSPFGLRAREEAARRALMVGHEDRFGLEAAIARSDLPVRMALNAPTDPQLVRLRNGAWVELRPSTLSLPFHSGLEPHEAEGTDGVLLESSSEGETREALRQAVARDLGRNVEAGDPADVVRGAFVAAGRMARGQPIHYDFLPQIETICDGPEGPQAVGLVAPGARLRAGEVYRSEVPARFFLPARRERIVVWLRRAEDPPRRAEVTGLLPIARPVEVALHLEQVPAAGRARLTLRSPAWATPHEVHWEDAQEDPRDWQAIIDGLETRPGWPDLWKLPHSRMAWQQLASAVATQGAADPGWPFLAEWLSRSNWTEGVARETGRLFDSAGQPPDRIDPGLLAWVDQRLDRGSRRLVEAAGRRRAPPDQCLRALTWSFGRCPRPVLEVLLGVLSAHVQGGSTPFDGPGQVKMWFHGLGRIATTASEARTIFDALFRYPDAHWTADHLACAAFLVSRIEDGWAVLSRNEPARLVELACDRLDLSLAAGTFGANFLYAPPLIAGLLRRRQGLGAERRFLLEGRDPLAAEVAPRLDRARTALIARGDALSRKWVPLLVELLKFIRTGAGDNGLLGAMLS